MERDANATSATETVAPQHHSGGQIDQALLSGLAWTGAARYGVQALTWVTTLLVARLLSPDDYGLVALATVYLGIVTILSEFGVGTSVVVLRDLTEDQIARLSGFSIVVGSICFLASFPAAPLLAAFFRDARLAPIIVALAITFIFVSFRTVPASLLQRDLRFRTLAGLEAVRALVQAVLMITLAVLGYGYWTLVIGAIAGAVVHSAMTFAARPHRIAWPRRGAMRRALTVSLDVLGSRLSWYLYSNSDTVVAGRMFPVELVGAYNIAWQFASVPVERVSALALQVTPSVLSAVQKSTTELRRIVLNLTEAIALVTVPTAIGLSLVADRFVLVILTDKYADAIVPLRVLAAYAAVRSVTALLPPVLTAQAMTRAVFHNSLLALLLMPAAFVVGSRWGITGIAVAWVLVHPVIVVNIGRQALRSIELSAGRYLLALQPALTGSAVMAAAVLLLRFGLPGEIPLVARFIIESVGGALVYGAILLLFHRDRLARFLRFLRNRRPDAAA
jgi:PST family polysaccharide transporter